MSSRSPQPVPELPAVPLVLPAADRVLRQQDVVDRVGLSIETIYRRIKVSEFPRPVRLGPQSVGWRESAINAWIASLPEVDLAVAESENGDDQPRQIGRRNRR